MTVTYLAQSNVFSPLSCIFLTYLCKVLSTGGVNELQGNDMIEARGLFLLAQVFKDADVFSLQNLDREDFRRVTSKNKAVE